MAIEVQAAADTHRGMKRPYNQDSVLTQVVRLSTGSTLALLMVADGVGGQKAGGLASQMTVATIQSSLEDLFSHGGALVSGQFNDNLAPDLTDNESLFDYMQVRLNEAIQAANMQIRQYAANHIEEAGNMRSTITCALLHDSLAIIANVGDSRTYIYSDDFLEQVTEDHSVVAEMVRAGQLTADQAIGHARGNVITRALGHRRVVNVDLFRRYLISGDQLLLCSDGLWEMITDEEQLAAMLYQSPDQDSAVQALIQAANAAGGKDNIGVVVAKLVDPTAATVAAAAHVQTLPDAPSSTAETLIGSPPSQT